LRIVDCWVSEVPVRKSVYLPIASTVDSKSGNLTADVLMTPLRNVSIYSVRMRIYLESECIAIPSPMLLQHCSPTGRVQREMIERGCDKLQE
jgi:hypothetical protein